MNDDKTGDSNKSGTAAPQPPSTESDQILALADTLRAEVVPVLAPKLAYSVELAARLVTSYRLRERRNEALRRSMSVEL